MRFGAAVVIDWLGIEVEADDSSEVSEKVWDWFSALEGTTIGDITFVTVSLDEVMDIEEV